jgi:metal-responsive CopG/Arc/MetJ family transcriptional regulator
MKEKTSVTLSARVLEGIDRATKGKQSRSAFLESLAERYLLEEERARIEARDLAIINRNAQRLNRDALDGLEDQAPLGEFPEE